MRRTTLAVATFSFATLALLSACTSSSGSPPTAKSTRTPTGAASAAPPVAPAGALPTSCKALPVALIGTDIGGIAASETIPRTSPGVSCEWTNSNASKAVIITVGHGAIGPFTTLKTQLSAIETVATVPGFDAGAFTVTKGGVLRGLTALTSSGEMVVVSSTLTLAQDEAMIDAIAK